MVEGEKIVFKLSKAIWNECRERDLKLLEKLEAKEAELAYHKNIVYKSFLSPSSTASLHSQNICSNCTKLSNDCICKKVVPPASAAATGAAVAGAEAGSVVPKVPGKRGRKRKLSEDKLTHQNLLAHLIRLRDTLSTEELNSYLPAQECEQYVTLVPSLTTRDLINHMISVRVEFVQRLMRPLIQKLISHPRNGDVFNQPVDPIALGLRDYFQRISKPMDLGTMRCNLLHGDYYSIEECAKDVNLVFNNAILYNPSTHVIHQNALLLRSEFQEEMRALQDRLAKEEEKKSQHHCDICLGSLCLVCGERCMKLEPTILVCYGPCGQRIKKQSTYFISPDGGLLWCQKCYTAANSVIVESYDADHTPLLKRDLLRRKFDEEAVETWIQCSLCRRRIHQVCALYNNLHDKAVVKEKGGSNCNFFQCPLCKLNLSPESNRKKSILPTPKKTKAEERNSLSNKNTISPNLSRLQRLEERVSEEILPTLSFSKPSHKNIDGHSVTFSTQNSVQLIYPTQNIQGQRTGSSDTSDESMDIHDRGHLSLLHADDGLHYEESDGDADGDGDVDVEVDQDGDENENEDVLGDAAPVPEEDDSMCVVTDNDGDLEEESEEEQKCIIDKRALSSHCASLVEEIVDGILYSRSQKRSTGRPRKYPKPPLITKPPTEKWKASSLPQTKLSDFIESMVHQKLEQCGFGDVINSITIRMTSNSFHNFEVPDVITNNLPTNDGYHVSQYLYYKQKCILLFQNIDGVDVCLFCLYVQEFDDTCPEPNRSKVYIAYLDSVEYFRPRCVRTAVYHEILVAYLIWCQARGFKQCHIWACPPQRGDNFIFWCHNPQQRNPSRDRLNSWYNSMLSRASQLGILKSIDTLWSTYFSPYGKRDELSQRTASKNSFVAKNSVLLASKTGNSSCDIPPPVCPPIFEGDFWVNECSRIFRLVQARSKGIEGQDKNVNLRKIRDLLKQLMSKPMASPFNQPVDHVLLNIPDYPTIITTPMDLGTIRTKLRMNQYKTILEFAKDVRLTFTNAMLYNPQSHPIHSYAQKLLEDFEHSLYDIVTERLGDLLTPSTDIDSTLATYPLCTFFKTPKEDCTSSKNSSIVNTEMNRETLCLTRRVSFIEVDCKIESETSNGGLYCSSDFNNNNNSSSSNSNNNNNNSSNININSNYIQDDEDLCEGKNNIDNDENEILPGLSRQDSTDSLISMNDWPRRPDHTTSHVCLSSDLRTPMERKIFEKSQLGQKGVLTLMSELSRNVCRLKDDMYVITFADSLSADPPQSCPTQNLTKSDDFSTTIVESSSNRGGKGKGKGLSVVGSYTTPSQLSKAKDSEKIPAVCLALLENIKSDTSDPDNPIYSPFIDSRQTFLEMCQFRHYQYDSLRRAKFSSMMLLYHLLYPQSKSTRPVCSECNTIITTVRWHCTLCLDSHYDVCGECVPIANLHHEHQDLTPVRLTYV